MSISQSLNNAVSGLTATSRMAEVVSANLSNALTEGYGRRELAISAQDIGGQGGGVRIDGVVRVTDRGIISDRRIADADLAAASLIRDTIAKVEQVFSPPDDAAGLGGRIAALEQAFVDAAFDPGSDQRLGIVLKRLEGVRGKLNSSASEIQDLRQDADAAIARDIQTLNAALTQVAKLNSDIIGSAGQGGGSAALMDARQVAIDRMADIVPLREVQRPNGVVALYTVSGAMLLDGKPQPFSFAPTPTITADMTYDSSALGGLMRNGSPIYVSDGVGRLSGGSLGAAFSLRDQTLVQAQMVVDSVAADLVMRFQDPIADPSISAGDAGLLTDSAGAYDPVDFVGLASRIGLNADIDPSRGGMISRIRDGVGAAASGPIGDPAQLRRFSFALTDTSVTGISAITSVADASSDFSTNRLLAEENQVFATARHDTVFQAELSQGVDSDVELQILLRVEQAYGANAKLMQTIQSMIQTLLEI